MTEPFDTNEPSGRFFLTISAGMAEMERETILERMSLGSNRAARDGKWLGGIVPFGYRVNAEKYLEINEDILPGCDISEAEVIRIIFKLCLKSRYSCVKIADYLNALGIPPAYVKDNRQIQKGKRKENTAGIWLPGRIYNLLTNTTYKGLHRYGKRSAIKREIIERVVPTIIPEEKWETAQVLLNENRIEAVAHAKRDYLLSGLIICGSCGLHYNGTLYKNNCAAGGKLPYYKCNGKQRYRTPIKCESKNIPAEWIEETVWNDCVSYLRNPGEIIKKYTERFRTEESKVDNIKNEIKLAQSAFDGKERERQSILDLYRKKFINGSEVETQLGKIAGEAESLKLRIKELQYILKTSEKPNDKIKEIQEMLGELNYQDFEVLEYHIKKQIIRLLVRQIIVFTKIENEGNKQAYIDIYYTFTYTPTRTGNRDDERIGVEIVKKIKAPKKY